MHFANSQAWPNCVIVPFHCYFPINQYASQTSYDSEGNKQPSILIAIDSLILHESLHSLLKLAKLPPLLTALCTIPCEELFPSIGLKFPSTWFLWMTSQANIVRCGKTSLHSTSCRILYVSVLSRPFFFFRLKIQNCSSFPSWGSCSCTICNTNRE